MYKRQAADFSGDGFEDLVTANFGQNTVTVLLGSGLGGFTPAANSPFAVGNGPASVAVGDFNADGNQDLAVANFNDSTVTAVSYTHLVFNASPGPEVIVTAVLPA